MSAIGPGDFVERVPSTASPLAVRPVAANGEIPQIGKIYQVRDVRRLRDVSGATWDGLRLVGIVLAVPGHPDAFIQAKAFRPIYRPKSEIIEALKQPAPEREPEHV